MRSFLLMACTALFFARLVSAVPVGISYTVSTVAGTGSPGAVDGNGTLASFSYPEGICVDPNGNIYVADSGNHKIRRIMQNGTVETWAGTGNASLEDGAASQASFNSPRDVSIDIMGNLLVADTSNGKIRKISPSRIVSTLGNNFDFPNQYNRPQKLAALGTSIYFTRETQHEIYWMGSNGSTYPFAGTGSRGRVDASASLSSFFSPKGVTTDLLGNCYIADSGNNKIRKYSGGDFQVSTIAGTGHRGAADGAGLAVSFNYPTALAIDSSGVIYVADTGSRKIRMIAANGTVSTIAGSGQEGDVDGEGKQANFGWLTGIAVDSAGNVYVSDSSNHKIKKLTPKTDSSPAPSPTPSQSPNVPKNEMVKVDGGKVPPGLPSGWITGEVPTFFISKYEISWADWKWVRSWAQENGYDIGYFGEGLDENYPVQSVNWYDAVKWCNAKSEMEGLVPFYSWNGEIFRTGEVERGDRQFFNVETIESDGYRLPSVREWQWAARGGLKSLSYLYSGSNNVVDATKNGPLGTNIANELGIHDMSGNVAEWTNTRGSSPEFGQILSGDDKNYYVAGEFDPLQNWNDIGFRIARSFEGAGSGNGVGSIPPIGNIEPIKAGLKPSPRGVKKPKSKKLSKSKKKSAGPKKKASPVKKTSKKKNGSKKIKR